MRAGKGHKYWHNFEQEVQDKIEKLADSINKLLFEPAVKRPIKSLDLPICDKNNNTLTLVYDFVSFANADDKNKDNEDKDDQDGQATIRCLKNTEKLVQLFGSIAPGSYGLHPVIYCYSNKGNFRPASFYGAMEFVKNLSLDQSLRTKFIKNRKVFENFLFENDCNGVQREHNKKLNNGLPILHKVPPKRDYGRYFCILAEKGGTSHGGLTEKLSPFFYAQKQEVNAYGR